MPSKTTNRSHGVRPAVPAAISAPSHRAAAVTPAPGAPWANVDQGRGDADSGVIPDQARRRRLRAIDRSIARRGDQLTELLLCVEGRGLWHPVCTCGWTGQGVARRESAQQAARSERARLFDRPLGEAVEHSGADARSEVA